MRVERAREVVGMERRRGDGLLEVHPEVEDVEEELERPLVLVVTAGGTERHPGATLAEGDRGGEGRPRPLAGCQRVGRTGLERELLGARPKRESEAGDDRG